MSVFILSQVWVLVEVVFVLFASKKSPLKMMKNVLYFIFIKKALFVLEISKYLSWLFGHVEKTAWLER